MARATWDTGWFQAEIYSLLFNRLGYQVEGPGTMENQVFYEAVAEGRVDLWVNGWFPIHEALVVDDDPVELVGTQVDAGALQGYFIDSEITKGPEPSFQAIRGNVSFRVVARDAGEMVEFSLTTERTL